MAARLVILLIPVSLLGYVLVRAVALLHGVEAGSLMSAFDRTPDDEYADAGECALYLGERFNLPARELLEDPLTLIEAFARWQIRGDEDAEAMTWLRELVDWQRVDVPKFSRAVAHIVEAEMLPCIEALACSKASWPELTT
jgi:hypothetical protein